MTSTDFHGTDPKEGTMTTTFDLDAHLAECAERMQAFVAQVLAPKATLLDEFTNTDGMTMLLVERKFALDVSVDEVVGHTAAPEQVLLTSDGRYAETHAWHEGPADDAEWVRYERYSARGMESHGFVHGVSRRLVQTG